MFARPTQPHLRISFHPSQPPLEGSCDDGLKSSSSPTTTWLACCASMALPSAWTAKAAGATMCSSNGRGRRSSASTSICMPTPEIPKLSPRWTAT